MIEPNESYDSENMSAAIEPPNILFIHGYFFRKSWRNLENHLDITIMKVLEMIYLEHVVASTYFIYFMG
jgi:hypothetical protein